MKTLFQSLKITIAFCVIFFVGYVMVLWGFGSIMEPARVGQRFTEPTYFWGRPSAVDYNGSGSGASNKGVSNPEYIADVDTLIDAFLVAHPYLTRAEVPSEMVTASGSGLDPHISVQGAAVQIERVAGARGMTVEQITKIVNQIAVKPMLGKPFVNVLELNVALDRYPKKS